MTRAIYFHPPVFSVALYYCPLPALEVRSINLVSNGLIVVEYLGVRTGYTAESAVAMAVVMEPVRRQVMLQVMPKVLQEPLLRLNHPHLQRRRQMNSFLRRRPSFSLCSRLNYSMDMINWSFVCLIAKRLHGVSLINKK